MLIYTLYLFILYFVYSTYFISTLLYFIYIIYIFIYTLYLLIFYYSVHSYAYNVYSMYIMYFFILFSYSCSHKHIKTHHDFNIFILVTQCQDCGDTWCYDRKADKRVGFLSRLAVSPFFAVLEAKPQMLLYQFFSHYCFMFLYFRL